MTWFPEAPRRQTDARRQRGARTLRGAFGLFVSFAQPRLLVASLTSWLALRLGVGGFDRIDAAIVAAIVVYWPFQEWAAHIALLHFKPRTVLGLRIDPFAARMHRWHHRNPWIIERIFLPKRVLVLLTPVHAAIWWWACDERGHALTGIAAFTAMALAYEWVHYIVHVPYIPRSRYARRIWKNHQLHHFKHEEYWHAFMAPGLDRLFGTSPDPKTIERSPTVRTLGVDDDFGEPKSSS